MNRFLLAFFIVAALARLAGAQCLEWTQLSTPATPANWPMNVVYDRARHTAIGIMGSHPQLTNQVVLYKFTAQGWTQINPPPPAPLGPRFSFTTCYHPARQTVLLFGGYTGIGAAAVSANDLWEWDGLGWVRIQHAGPWPAASGADLMTYDPGRQRIILLSGAPSNGWATWEWTGQLWEQGPILSSISDAHARVSLCFDEFRRVGFVYAVDPDTENQEMWEYTPGTTAAQGIWTQVTANEPPTEGLEVVSLVYDPYRRKIIRQGGRFTSDSYAFDPTTAVWNVAERRWDWPSAMPYAQRRAASGACYDTDLDRLILYGGARQDWGPPATFTGFTDTWVFTDDAPGLVVDVAPTANWCPGQTGVLSISVAGSAFVQWYKNGQPISGATSTILVVNPVSAASAGVYDCLVSNNCGAIWSRPCTVSVTIPPTITSQPIGDDRCPGQNVNIVGPTASGTNPQFKLQHHNGFVWVDVPFQYNPVGNFYVLPNAQNIQSGWYRFEVSNSCGTAYSNQFHIQIGVTFTQQTPSQAAEPCATVVFTVGAQGVGTLSYAWQRNGVPLVDNGHITGAQTSTLTIHGMRYEDEAMYECLVTDSCETQVTGGSYLFMQSPPQWVHRTSSGPVRRVPWYTDMAYDESRGVCVLYGGSVWTSATSTFWGNDTWEWDGVEWTRRFPAHNPGPRAGHEMVYDSVRNKILLIGGSFPGGFDAVVWQYDGTDWTLLTTSAGGPNPDNFYQGDAAFDRSTGKVVFQTNQQGGVYPANRTWEFDPATLAWQSTYAGTSFTFDQAQLIYDQVQNSILASALLNFAAAVPWRYTGTGWQQLGTTGPFRYNPVVAFDSFRNRPTLFGNARNELNYANFRNDTYALDVNSWVQILPEFQPVVADRLWPAAMCFDTRRNAMVVVGNTFNNYTGLNPMDTWEYRYLDKIVIDRQPVDQPLAIGATTQFSVSAAGAGTLTYQWRKGSTSLVNGPTPAGSTISGAQTGTLTITNTAAADAGAYSCLISNACGSLASDAAQLGVACYPNCDQSAGTPLLTANDFVCFINAYASGQPAANCDGSTGTPMLTANDFVCFVNEYAAGCAQ